MTTRPNVQSLALAAILIAAGGAAALLLTARPTYAQQADQPVVSSRTTWEYAIVRLEGPEPRHRDASLAVLRSYGAEGWEAVELLPPAYDILMKRPTGR